MLFEQKSMAKLDSFFIVVSSVLNRMEYPKRLAVILAVNCAADFNSGSFNHSITIFHRKAQNPELGCYCTDYTIRECGLFLCNRSCPRQSAKLCKYGSIITYSASILLAKRRGRRKAPIKTQAI